VFRGAGIYGLLVVAPMLFLESRISRDLPPPITHPEYYYGFICVTLTFQILFLVIASDPVRFRPLMPVAVLEKFSYWAAIVALLLLGRVGSAVIPFAAIDVTLGIFFVVSYLRTASRPDA
jgi:hypothetical protein